MTISKWPLIVLLSGLSLSAVANENPGQAIAYGNNPDAGQYLSVNGIDLYFEVYGSGKPLLVIHGNGQSIADMHFQIEHFSDDYKVVVADSRGHGKTGLGDDPLTYLQMMEDYNVLLEHLGLAQVNVFGWSDGGILALLLAINHPEKVGKMAIMGANLRPDQSAFRTWVLDFLHSWSAKVSDKIKQGDTAEDWLNQSHLIDLITHQTDIPVASLHTITAPVLVMAGDKDIIRAEHTLEIFENLQHAHLAILPGQTHWAPANAPADFNALVERFFNRTFARPTSREILEAELNPQQE